MRLLLERDNQKVKDQEKQKETLYKYLPKEIQFGNINQAEFKGEKLIEARTGLYKT